MKQAYLAATAIAVCLALIGLAAADDAPVATSHFGRRPRFPPAPAPTAWSFIESRPELSYMAEILEWAGKRDALSLPYSGTLLVPNNAAVETYLGLMEYTPSVTTNAVLHFFWEAIIKYHMLSRAASTRQKRTIELDTTHIREPETAAVSTRSFRGPTQPMPSNFHKITFLHRRTYRRAAPQGDVSASTFRQAEAYAVQDEQGNDVTFASKNNAVLGGGLVHVVNAVLQPDDVYPTLKALLDSRPELGIITTIIDIINMTTPWPDTCLWIDSGLSGEEPILLDYNAIPQDFYHTCRPCWQSFYGCRPYDYSYLQYSPESPLEYLPRMYSPGRRLAAFRALMQENMAAAAGTVFAEVFAGTFALPSDVAFQKKYGGLPDPVDPKVWKPIVQNHFIGAGDPRDNFTGLVDITSEKLLRYDTKRKGGFGRGNTRNSFLGQMRNDTSYQQTYTTKSSGCENRAKSCPIIEFPVLGGGRDTTNIIFRTENRWRPGKPASGMNLQTPGHFYHMIDKVMEPLCGNEDNCNRVFTQNPAG